MNGPLNLIGAISKLLNAPNRLRLLVDENIRLRQEVSQLAAKIGQTASEQEGVEHVYGAVSAVGTNLDLHRLADRHQPIAMPGVNDTDRWHRSPTLKFYPLLDSPSDIRANFAAYIKRHIISDFPSMGPIFHFDKTTLTYGSCFAARIRDYLVANKAATDNMYIPEGMNNTFALRSYFEWILEDGKAIETAFIKSREGRIVNWSEMNVTEETRMRAVLQGAGGFIFTLGMTEVWRNKITGDVFWRGVPEDIFQKDLHESHESTFLENLDNIKRLISLIRDHCGNMPVVFTVSPVALTATFRGTSAIVADCASKATLRAVMEQVMRESTEGVYYWPSFEIVRWLGAHIPHATFTEARRDEAGKVINDSVHIPDWVVAGIVDTFISTAFHPQPPDNTHQ